MTKYLHIIREAASMVNMARQVKPCEFDKDVNQFALCYTANEDLNIAFIVNETIFENKLASLTNI